jgi:hypothetical protein
MCGNASNHDPIRVTVDPGLVARHDRWDATLWTGETAMVARSRRIARSARPVSQAKPESIL